MSMTKHEGRQALIYQFLAASTQQVDYIPVPIAGDITGVRLVTGATPSNIALCGVAIGSAGSVVVVTANNTAMVAGGIEALTVVRTAVTTANSIKVVRDVQGTTGESAMAIIIENG